MIDARRTELLTIRIEHGDRTVPSDLISALQTIPDGWVISDIPSGLAASRNPHRTR